jgi:hypothetical protein
MTMDRAARRLVAGGLAALTLAACAPPAAPTRVAGAGAAPMVVEIHRSPTCTCCHGHAEHLRMHQVVVKEVEREDLAEFKAEIGVPADMQSCHTTLVDGYFVEGHVPIEAIRHLLETRPDIDGITLPGMPAGSPGMGGDKSEPWVIFGVDGQQTEEFLTL